MRARKLAPRGEATRERILESALQLLRRRGLEATTMRDIAEAAGVALGATYYYFDSKEAIVLAYYERTQQTLSERARAAFDETSDVRARLGAAMHTKLDVLAKDRRLLSVLFRSLADPSEPLSVFSPKTRGVREESIRVFDEAIAPSPAVATLDARARRVLALAMWSMHMGVMLYFIHDRSPKQEKTRALTDRTLDLVCGMLPMAPDLAPVLGAQIASVLAQADLLGALPAGAVTGAGEPTDAATARSAGT
jgi:AcrR family transcriptional regulator